MHVTGAGYDRIPLDLLGPDVRVANTFHHGRSIAERMSVLTEDELRQLRELTQKLRRPAAQD